MSYTVEVASTARHQFHVTATFSGIRQPTFDVALPVWTPGDYIAKNYATNVLRLVAHDLAGNRLRVPKTQPSAWRIENGSSTSATVEFEYTADEFTDNGAGIADSYAFFTGTQLFLEPVGHRDVASTVRFIVPNGWRIASALHETSDPMVFAAEGYDELVDAPTALGQIGVTSFDVAGKRHELVEVPAGRGKCATDVASLTPALTKIILSARAIFGSLPYDRYVIFCVDPWSGIGLEHGNSFVKGPVPMDPKGLSGVAHEFFHLWNVKRIRPAEMWPYDYSRVNPGPSLWVSEGVTSYYQVLLAYRSGMEGFADLPREGVWPAVAHSARSGEEEMLAELAQRFSQFEGSPQRRYVSPSDASITDGLCYGCGNPSYYTSGELLGGLLDLSILHDTRGARRLDDVMRALYTERYLQGRGFTPNDVVAIVSRIAGRDYSSFFRSYVTGTEDFPVDSILAFAGYRVSRSTRTLGSLGIMNAHATPEGRVVVLLGGPRSPATRAGVVVGDVITAVDGVPIHQLPLAGLYGDNWIGGSFLGKAEDRVMLSVRRDTTRLQIPVTLNRVTQSLITIEPDAGASEQARAVRAAWLKR